MFVCVGMLFLEFLILSHFLFHKTLHLNITHRVLLASNQKAFKLSYIIVVILTVLLHYITSKPNMIIYYIFWVSKKEINRDAFIVLSTYWLDWDHKWTRHNLMTATLWTYFLICQNVVCNETAMMKNAKCLITNWKSLYPSLYKGIPYFPTTFHLFRNFWWKIFILWWNECSALLNIIFV